nr:hypothetical protein CFP56_09453 [Quercus suber]
MLFHCPHHGLSSTVHPITKQLSGLDYHRIEQVYPLDFVAPVTDPFKRPGMDMLTWHQRVNSRSERSRFELPVSVIRPLLCEKDSSRSFSYSHDSGRYVNQIGGPLEVYGISTSGNEYPFYEYASRSRIEQKHYRSRTPYRPLPPTTPAGRPLTITQGKDDTKSKSASPDRSTWGLTRGVPALPGGTNYMFAIEHTTIHILRQPLSAWKDKYRGQKLPFMIQKVSTEMSVGVVMRNVMSAKVGRDFSQCEGWAITEIIEQGDGKWAKVHSLPGRDVFVMRAKLSTDISQGSTVLYGSTKAAGPLSSMGWNAKRGTSLPPVWLTVHKFQGPAKDE